MIIMARHRSNENVCNLEFHHVQTSASKKVMITVSDPFPLMIYFIRSDDKNVENQFDFFMANQSEGLTQAGRAELNQSIEAFVYCILGAQVNVRS